MHKGLLIVGKIAFCTAILILAIVATTIANAQAAGSSMEGFRELKVAPGHAVGDDFLDVLLPFLRGHPESEEGDASLDMKVRKTGAGFSVDVIQTGYLDDVLAGNHYRGHVIRTSAGQWELLTMFVKPICARGQNVDGYCKSTPKKAPPAMFLSAGANPSDPLHCVKVAKNDALNVRKGPGARYPIVGALARGDCGVAVSNNCNGSWCQISAGNVSGWAHTGYLQAVN